MRILTFDAEIQIDPRQHKDGWAAARRGDCGLASFVVYDTGSQRYHIYGADVDRAGRVTMGNLIDGAMHLSKHADLLVSFNGVGFDIPLIESTTGIRIPAPHYDILAEIWLALQDRTKGYGLGPVCERTLGIEKSGDGERAPSLFQSGRFAQLYDYNLNDVHMTRHLFNHIMEAGWIIRPDGSSLDISRPAIPEEERA